MQLMSTFDSAAVWSATSLAFDEKKIGAAGLSVRQRKLLTLLSQPASIPQLAQSIALPIEDVRTALERFAKLGLAQSSDTVLIAPMPTQLRGTAAIAAPSRLPMLIGVGVAVMLAVSLGAWLLRGDHPSAPISPAAGSGPKASTPTAIGPGDTADSALPPSAARALAVTPQPAPALASAATTNSAAAATAAAAAARPVAAPAVATKSAATLPVAATVTPPTVAPTGVPSITPAPTLATAPPATVVAPPVAAPVVIASPAPVTQVAAAAATSAPAASPPAVVAARPAAAREIKLVTRVEPTFPRGFDADKGTVRARLQVNAQGAVTGVDIVESNPPRIFDRTVRTALQQWRYEPTGEAFSVVAEIIFNR